uniref:Reverse transcriptase domain-containing protein n=1 Tax=Tanacetum cinerariifolium TaxID=118510 RepID=A0A6L2NYQ9_TANCI|nr:reverse transcriptase domain-containing protein [Tanacetum cinerariifolium]
MNTKEHERRHRSRRSRSPRPSIFSRIKRGRSRSPRQNSREKEGGVLKRLGNRERSVSTRSDSHSQRSYSRYTKALSESEDSGGGHWKSRSKKEKSSREQDDLSQQWNVKGAPECMWISGFVHGITNPKLIKRLHDKIPKTVDEMMRVTTSFLRREVAASNHERKKPFPPWRQQEDEGIEGPMIIEAEIGGHCIHRMYVDGGSASEILYEHGFKRLLPEIKNQLVPTITSLIGFSGEVTIPIQWNYKKAWNQEVASSSVNSSRNTEDPCRRRNNHLKSSMLVPLEYVMVSGPEGSLPVTKPMVEERIKVAINPEHPEQTVMIGYTLTEEGRNRLCNLLQRNLDVFAWKPADMTSHDDSRRMCVDFKDLNKACPKDGYPLPDWKVESLCGFPFKCFLDSYKGYHQIQMAEEDKEKTAFITSQRIFYYTKMPFGMRNTRATYQCLVDKAFHKQIVKNLKVYVDDLVIKSRMEDEIARDIEETFKTLREINMKLNPKKCTFGIEEGMFLGYKVSTRGLKVCPDKTAEAKEVFKQMKQLIGELPMLVAPMEKKNYCLPGSNKRNGRLQKWSIKLGEYAIHYRPRVSVKGQKLADFIVERPEEDSLNTQMTEEEELPEPWILFTDGSSCTDEKMSRDMLIVVSTMRIPLLYRGEYSQWVERFMNYLEEQTDREVMINCIKNGDQPLPRVTQVSIAKTSSTEQPPLKDKSIWSDQEKKIQKIDRLARSLPIQGLLNDIYSLIDSNKTAKDLWDALARHMLGSEYDKQDRKAAVLYEYETFKSTEGELFLDTYI